MVKLPPGYIVKVLRGGDDGFTKHPSGGISLEAFLGILL